MQAWRRPESCRSLRDAALLTHLLATETKNHKRPTWYPTGDECEAPVEQVLRTKIWIWSR